MIKHVNKWITAIAVLVVCFGCGKSKALVQPDAAPEVQQELTQGTVVGGEFNYQFPALPAQYQYDLQFVDATEAAKELGETFAELLAMGQRERNTLFKLIEEGQLDEAEKIWSRAKRATDQVRMVMGHRKGEYPSQEALTALLSGWETTRDALRFFAWWDNQKKDGGVRFMEDITPDNQSLGDKKVATKTWRIATYTPESVSQPFWLELAFQDPLVADCDPVFVPAFRGGYMDVTVQIRFPKGLETIWRGEWVAVVKDRNGLRYSNPQPIHLLYGMESQGNLNTTVLP